MLQPSFVVEVRRKWPIALDTYAFEVIGADGARLPAFEAGAHVDIIAGPGLSRQYSIASNPADPGSYLLGILKTPNPHGVSTALCERVDVGSRLRLSGPRNHFPLTEDAPFSLLIGGGIGITPMLAMAHRLHDLGQPFAMHFFARNKYSAPFLKEIRELPFSAQVTVYFDESDGNPREHLQTIVAGADAGAHVYTCGPNGFMNAVLELSKQFIPDERIHKEVFEFEDSADADTEFEIEIKSTGQVLTVPQDRAVIDVLQEAGIFIQRNCPRGVCGACARQVLEGEIDHRDSVLPAQAREQGYMLLCVSRARSQRLVLDV